MNISSSGKQWAIAALAVCAVLISIAMFRAKLPPNEARKISDMNQNIGEAMAKLANQAAAGKGSVVLLLPDDSKGDPRRLKGLKTQQAAFESALSGLTIEGRETFGALASRGDTYAGKLRDFNLASLRELAKRYPAASVMVSFVGEPTLKTEEMPAKDEKFPPLVCLSGSGKSIPSLMAQGLITAAIVPRSTPTPYRQGVRGDWFDVMFETVTPETVGAWAAASGLN